MIKGTIEEIHDREYNTVELQNAQEMTFEWQKLIKVKEKLNGVAEYPKSYTVDRADFYQLFKETKVAKVRVYPGIKEDPNTLEKHVTLLFVGVDRHGNDIIVKDTEASGIYDFSHPCPSTCGCSELYLERNDDCLQND